ncbi:hypothetical protein EIP91_007509 [Steccherinum ochraceum]|uniref:Uncharacterized protein n=1 Tax=Steccherinum ochraceum TaxID=92696 RepID=A0A4R0RCG0_9APHY|nr:hypothetical protein EIP91_007509 [Steccherinum ochraceum]
MNILTPGCNPGEANWKHTTTYPVSPRLLVMLRSNAMMPMQKFLDAGFTKEEAAAATPSVWGDKIPDNSYYKDFPRSMASVRYVPPVRGHDALAALIQNQRELGRRVDDVLTFQLHMLSSEQSFRVNSLRLENSPVWLTFKSPRKLIETLRYFETEQAGEATRGASNWSPTAGGPVYARRSYASLIRQLEYFAEHGSPPPPPTRPQPTASTSTPAPTAPASTSSSRPSAPRSTTTPPTTQDPSFHDMLRARTDPSSLPTPLSPSSHKKKTEEWAKMGTGTEVPEAKPRNPVLRRKVYAVPESVRVAERMLLQRLVVGVFPG